MRYQHLADLASVRPCVQPLHAPRLQLAPDRLDPHEGRYEMMTRCNSGSCGPPHESQPPGEPPSLDERIAEAERLLPHMRTLSRVDLHRLAVNLRVLANIAEAWETRTQATE